MNIRDFILDYEMTQTGFVLIGVESLILAIITGAYNNDLGIGIIAFFVSMVLFNIPLIGGAFMMFCSLTWSFLLWGIVSGFSSPLASWIIGIIAFIMALTIHMAAIEIDEIIFCYSFLLFEALIVAFCLYATYKSIPITIIAFIILIVLAFLPIVRHIEGLGLSIFIAIVFGYLASESLSKTASIIIGILIFIAAETIYIIMNSQFSWKDIIEGKKEKNNTIEFYKIEAAVYSKFPELEKRYYSFYNYICENETDKIYFSHDWKNYIKFINDSNQLKVVDFNKWYEDTGLYKCRNYNRDYYKKYWENNDSNEEQNREEDNQQEKTCSDWFKGIKDIESLKKRYRDLLKIYHPDNYAGDTSLTQQIQKEYEKILAENSWS